MGNGLSDGAVESPPFPIHLQREWPGTAAAAAAVHYLLVFRAKRLKRRPHQTAPCLFHCVWECGWVYKMGRERERERECTAIATAALHSYSTVQCSAVHNRRQLLWVDDITVYTTHYARVQYPPYARSIVQLSPVESAMAHCIDLARGYSTTCA